MVSDEVPRITRPFEQVVLPLSRVYIDHDYFNPADSFRRTLATLLQSSGASVKTTQELMRHSSPVGQTQSLLCL
jgi:integrase